MDTLKEHPFFKDINFSTLREQIAPVETSNICYSPMRMQLMKFLPPSNLKIKKYSIELYRIDEIKEEVRDFSDLVKQVSSGTKLNEMSKSCGAITSN